MADIDIDTILAVAHRRFDAGDEEFARSAGQALMRTAGDHPGVLHLAGKLALKDGNPTHAAELFSEACNLAPPAAMAANLAAALFRLGHPGKAALGLRQALEREPGQVALRYQLAKTLYVAYDLEAAACECGLVLRTCPDWVDARALMGAIAYAAKQYGAAFDHFSAVQAATPGDTHANNNLGMSLSAMGRHDEAIPYLRKAVEISPDNIGGLGNLLFCLTHADTESVASRFAWHAQYGAKFDALRAHWPAHRNAKDIGRPLRLGFVSADLRAHPVAELVEAIWTALDKTRFEIWVYHNNVAEDAVSARLRRLARQWHAVAGMDDAQLSGLILGEGIDILFDLSGHTAGNRLPVFARKPAPVQVSWLGYPATTGVAAVDYYWADRFLAPPGLDDPYFTEKIVRLPAVSRFLPEHDAPPLNPLPARSKGYFTFASFNRASKLSHAVVMLWARVLQAVPHSRLLLGALDNESMRGELLRQFAENGIPAGRVILHLRTDKQSYLRLHHEVDLLLDTFPYSGGTTSAHALWMGVPTLTMTGASLSSRQSATLLLHADLPGFIAKDESEFVALAAAWPERLEELDGIRASLRARIADSPMFDVAMIARGAERAATMMWQRWCDGLDPESFEVK